MQRHTRNKAFEQPWRSLGLGWSRLVSVGLGWSRLVSVGLGWSVVGEWDLVMAMGYWLVMVSG